MPGEGRSADRAARLAARPERQGRARHRRRAGLRLRVRAPARRGGSRGRARRPPARPARGGRATARRRGPTGRRRRVRRLRRRHDVERLVDTAESTLRPARRAREQRRRVLELPARAHARPAEFHRILGVNVGGAFLCIRAAAARMREAGRRRLDRQHHLDRRHPPERLRALALRHLEARDLGADEDDGARARARTGSA